MKAPSARFVSGSMNTRNRIPSQDCSVIAGRTLSTRKSTANLLLRSTKALASRNRSRKARASSVSPAIRIYSSSETPSSQYCRGQGEQDTTDRMTNNETDKIKQVFLIMIDFRIRPSADETLSLPSAKLKLSFFSAVHFRESLIHFS